MIVTIFKSLSVDQTVFIQFVSLLIIFIILSTVLFNRLKDVLDHRENKTTKLEDNAHAVYKKADELAEQYRAHVEKTHHESQVKSSKKKSDILTNEKSLIKEAEEKLTKEYEEKRAMLEKEFSEKRKSALAQVAELSSQLVTKITK